MSGAGDTVRIVRGRPRPEDLAALLAVLGALTGSHVPSGTAVRAAPWTRERAADLPASAWRTRTLPARRASHP
ncbi:acyl-CoA carboxylase epsilon subunit [Streptomyces sp. NPDC086080]|uniref:acyl-CoA carboxylase epsilon subunit n=1 Tax=Streptomyces sp. NPDC086080 TaxID=3365748 RepID=UPI0037CFCFF0